MFLRHITVALLVAIALALTVDGSTISRPLSDNYKGVTANFGQFRSRTGLYKLHDGMDFRASIGIPVRSIYNGTITETHDYDTPGDLTPLLVPL